MLPPDGSHQQIHTRSGPDTTLVFSVPYKIIIMEQGACPGLQRAHKAAPYVVDF